MPGATEADLYFSGVPRPVRLVRCAPLLKMARDVFPTWPFRVAAPDPMVEPVVVVSRRRGEYRAEAPWMEEPIFADTPVAACSGLVVDLVYAWLEANPPALCLHCAAVEFAGRLVVFPNTNLAGKSLLAARLMAEGRMCHGDDLVALTPDGEGMSFGVPPRLRLPLPGQERSAAEFVRSHGGAADARSRYLAPSVPCLAPFAEKRPIGAFVILERKENGPAELVPADFIVGLRNVIHQNLMRRGGVVEVFDRSKRLMEEKPCWRLRYARLDEAVVLLRDAFAQETGRGFTGPGPEEPGPVVSATESIAPERPRARRSRRSPSAERFVRRSEILLEQGQGSFFLIQTEGDAIFALNNIGWAVWELLAEPLGEVEAVALLASVFSETPRGEIERDVASLFADLVERRLVRPAEADAAPK
jgi:hypothetical protein